MAVNQKVFDVGVQTSRALTEYSKTKNPLTSGLVLKNGRGNGSLTRVFPLGLHNSDHVEDKIVEYAHLQSMITHGDIVPQICCAFYSLWVRETVKNGSIKESYERSVDKLMKIYEGQAEYLYYFNERLRPLDYNIKGKGTGYVPDTLRSVRDILFEHNNYRDVIINAVLLGNDTDTVAAIAGGIAGIHFANYF
jgi:ADP-ribosylglycohydrolase